MPVTTAACGCTLDTDFVLEEHHQDPPYHVAKAAPPPLEALPVPDALEATLAELGLASSEPEAANADAPEPAPEEPKKRRRW